MTEYEIDLSGLKFKRLTAGAAYTTYEDLSGEIGLTIEVNSVNEARVKPVKPLPSSYPVGTFAESDGMRLFRVYGAWRNSGNGVFAYDFFDGHPDDFRVIDIPAEPEPEPEDLARFEAVDGVRFDRTKRYEDKDGDVWEWRNNHWYGTGSFKDLRYVGMDELTYKNSLSADTMKEVSA